MILKSNQITIKISDDMMKGVYANNLVVAHSKEEFVLDFIMTMGPQGTVCARVITTPSHMKRFLKALNENMARYESQFGEIGESSESIIIN